jgi:hypothetical protein
MKAKSRQPAAAINSGNGEDAERRIALSRRPLNGSGW